MGLRQGDPRGGKGEIEISGRVHPVFREEPRPQTGVIEPGGQTVSALDRLYLAAHLPTLIVWGDRDPIIPVAHAYAAHDAMPGSRLEVFEGIGHFPHVECPDAFVAVLLDFLATTETTDHDPARFRELLLHPPTR